MLRPDSTHQPQETTNPVNDSGEPPGDTAARLKAMLALQPHSEPRGRHVPHLYHPVLETAEGAAAVEAALDADAERRFRVEHSDPVRQHPPLPQDRLLILFVAMNRLRFLADGFAEAGDVDRAATLSRSADAIRGIIVCHNLRLARHLAKYSAWFPEQIEDLTSEAAMMILRAADSFDFARGGKFSSYSTTYARHRCNLAANREMRHQSRRSTTTDISQLSSNRHAPIESRAVAGEVLAAVDSLTPNQRETITARFGLRGRRPQTQKTHGEIVGVTTAAIWMRKEAAMRRLRVVLCGWGSRIPAANRRRKAVAA